eukprot:scaffold174593_cov24-Tisochrysis_lutea.AAC.1
MGRDVGSRRPPRPRAEAAPPPNGRVVGVHRSQMATPPALPPSAPPLPPQYPPGVINLVEFNVAGQWGGLCTCPNGESYRVGDNVDACASLACIGGISGPCSQNGARPDGRGRRVTCAVGPPPPGPPPAIPPPHLPPSPPSPPPLPSPP